jgi:uncharacterized protein YqeY
MSVLEQIDNDFKEALKSQNSEMVSVLRMLKSAFKNTQIEKGHELSDQETIAVLEKQAKQRQDSIAQYKSGNREDLAAKEQSELDVISKYLPEKMSEEELRGLVAEIITELGASSMQDMGKVMKAVLEKANGKADGSMVSAIVKEKLS